MTNKKAISGSILAMLLWYILSYALSIYLTSYVNTKIGTEATGFVTFSKTFTSYANIITLAINSFATRFITISYHKGDYNDTNTFFSTVLLSDIVIGLVILFVSLIGSLYIHVIVKVSDNIVTSVQALFAINSVTFFITTIETAFSTSAYIKNKLNLVYYAKCAGIIAEILVLYLLFSHFTPSVWYVGLGSLIAALICLVGNVIITKNYVPEIKFRTKSFSQKALHELFFSGIWNSINQLGNVLNSGLDLYFSNILFSGFQMGQVSIAKTLNAIPQSFYIMLSRPLQPEILKKYSENDFDGVMKVLKLSSKLCAISTGLIFAGFHALGYNFLKLWVPTADATIVYYLTIWSLASCLGESCVYPLYYIYTLTLKNRVPCFVTIIGGLLNVLGMIVLSKYTNLGIYSIVITTAVIMNAINLIFNPIYMCHVLKIKKTYFYPFVSRCFVSTTIITFILFRASRILSETSSWIVLIMRVIAFGLVGLLLYLFFIFTKDERKTILNLARRRPI